ncbi:transposase [Bradyrhizobium sp. CSA112]|uniref:transposase n=1 Tax=Bradyrhizobium sp. CSA112 TaxID=2699170 RepID=UPI0023B1533D|nr:transposase [Bradyrhizobium sp. CSA112]
MQDQCWAPIHIGSWKSLAPGTSVVEVAQRHDVHRSLLTVWRRQARGRPRLRV